MFEYSDEQSHLRKMLIPLDKKGVILDVGCGSGRNLELLKQQGFLNSIGVDVNESLINVLKIKGLQAYTVGEYEEMYHQRKVDVLLFSHIVEHFEWKELLNFLEKYLELLEPNGLVIISTPLDSKTFYNDFDHIKPYLPQSFSMIFQERLEQVQLQSRKILYLEDICFYQLPLRLQWHRIFYVSRGASWPIWVNRILKFMYFISFGNIGYKAGWIGKYKYLGDRHTLN